MKPSYLCSRTIPEREGRREEGGREGGRERGREGGRERGREGRRGLATMLHTQYKWYHLSPLVILGSDPEYDGRFGGGVHVSRGQLGVAYDTRAPRSTVHAGKSHGPGLGPWLWFETEVHRILCDGPRGIGGGFPGEVGPLRTL